MLPSNTGVTYVDALGNSTYSIGFPLDNKGNPLASYAQITSGSSPFQGMTALETTYTLTVAARTTNGGDVKLRRTTQTVGIPLFQFGIFSETGSEFLPWPELRLRWPRTRMAICSSTAAVLLCDAHHDDDPH